MAVRYLEAVKKTIMKLLILFLSVWK